MMLHGLLSKYSGNPFKNYASTALSIFLVISTTLSYRVARADHVQPLNSQPSTVAANQRVIVNAVLPNPTSGPEWVELFNDSQLIYKIYIPLMTRGQDDAPSGGVVKAGNGPATNIAGWQLGNDDGNWYTIPGELPPVPYGAKVKIYFDGAGPTNNDYDFSDNLAVLHTPPGLTNIFPDLNGQAVLYASGVRTPETFRSKQAWTLAPPWEEKP